MTIQPPRRRGAPLLVIAVAVLLPLLARNLILPRRPAPAKAPPPTAPAPSRPAESPAAALPSPDRPALQGEEDTLRIPVNEAHLFEGEINHRGKPVGFHSRPGGHDPAGARVVEVLDGPNAAGVYTAEVEIRDPRSGRWLRKTSTFYPDRLQRAEVLQAVLHAYESRQGGGEKFRGPSGAGFTIEGYYQDGRINTAYPIFTRR